MIHPAPLKPGDKIAIIAPARKVSRPDIDQAIAVFTSWGLEVLLGKHLFSNSHNYLAGTDDERKADFQSFLDDADVRAIVSARGGYGSTRVIDDLDFSGFISSPKWLVGFSDITAVHQKVFSLGISSVHGTMPILFSRPAASSSVESLRDVLFQKKFSLEAGYNAANTAGAAEGIVVGGNLSLLADSLGSASEIATDNHILIIEEIDEYLYRLDRMMTQLKRAGKLKKLKGLVVGHFTSLKDSELPFGETYEAIIRNAVREYQYPIAFNFPTGHDFPNLAWIHGSTARLEVTANGACLQSSELAL